MPIVAGIDGTGAGWLVGAKRDAEYDRLFARSFVRRIIENADGPARYRRGPSNSGITLEESIRICTQHVKDCLAATPGERVLLTGYSRGGAGVIGVAQRLEREGIRVHAMMLFDAVDRQMNLDAYRSPRNVRHVLHVLRSRAGRTRESFGNCGTKAQWAGTGTDYEEHRYPCTHGGMGGTPWPLAPGQKESDFIDEGFAPYLAPSRLGNSELALVMNPLTVAFGVAGLVTRVRSDGGTNVSFRHDREVAGRIWHDVWPFLRGHGFIKPGVSRVWPGPPSS